MKSGESEVLQQKVEQSKLDLQGFQQRFIAGNRSLKYLEEQVQMHQDLLVSGNTSKSRLLDLQRERS
ncbi:HlyD family type I secretion periplasmic adaptor subunit, partial [Vibrio sp. 10N.261.45.A7]